MCDGIPFEIMVKEKLSNFPIECNHCRQHHHRLSNSLVGLVRKRSRVCPALSLNRCYFYPICRWQSIAKNRLMSIQTTWLYIFLGGRQLSLLSLCEQSSGSLLSTLILQRFLFLAAIIEIKEKLCRTFRKWNWLCVTDCEKCAIMSLFSLLYSIFSFVLWQRIQMAKCKGDNNSLFFIYYYFCAMTLYCW